MSIMAGGSGTRMTKRKPISAMGKSIPRFWCRRMKIGLEAIVAT
jgi:GTP:adenosylcobinamide-phosphate guanylyltransferase